MKQRRHGHYTGNKYVLPQSTHNYNTRSQGTGVEPMAQHDAVLATNLQVHHQKNVVIDPTTGISLEYRNIIEEPTKAIWKIHLQMKSV